MDVHKSMDFHKSNVLPYLVNSVRDCSMTHGLDNGWATPGSPIIKKSSSVIVEVLMMFDT